MSLPTKVVSGYVRLRAVVLKIKMKQRADGAKGASGANGASEAVYPARFGERAAFG
jgi:hypothetical protein